MYLGYIKNYIHYMPKLKVLNYSVKTFHFHKIYFVFYV